MDILEEFKEAVEEHTLEGYDEFFSANAFLGEAGELANARKKQTFKDDYLSIRKLLAEKDFHENSIDEAGDTLFYLFQWLEKAGIKPEEAMRHQINKLKQKSVEYGKIFKK